MTSSSLLTRLRRRKSPVEPPCDPVQEWIDCVVSMCQEPDDTGRYTAAHYIFAKKVLREPSRVAVQIAGRFGSVPLTRAECEHIYRDWWVCDGCGGPVEGGIELCDDCKPAEVEAA